MAGYLFLIPEEASKPHCISLNFVIRSFALRSLVPFQIGAAALLAGFGRNVVERRSHITKGAMS